MAARTNQTHPSKPDSGAANELVRLVLQGAFGGKAWQGPTLSGSLRGVTAPQALWRPAPGRKCIWEQTLHAAYWKWTIARILSLAVGDGEDTEAFPRSPSNWPAVPSQADENAWKGDRSLLTTIHRNLMTIAATIPAERFHERPTPKHKYTVAFYIAGAAAHDGYHTGQVQLIKRLMPTSLRPARNQA